MNRKSCNHEEKKTVRESNEESEYLHGFHEIQRLSDEVAEKELPEEDSDQAKNSETSDKHGIPDYEKLFNENLKNDEDTQKGNGAAIWKMILKKNAFKIFVSMLLDAAKGAGNWVMPLVTANIINLVATQSESREKMIFINVIVLLLVFLQNIPMHVVYSKFTNKILRSVGAGLRNMLIKKLQHLSFTYHKEIETGKIQSKFLRDIEAIETFNTQFVKTLLPVVTSIIISMSISMSKSIIVTLFFACVIPFNGFVVYGFRKKMAVNNRSIREATENVSSKVTSMLEMIQVTKAHGLEEEEITSAEHNVEELYEKGMTLDVTNSYFETFSWVLSQCLRTVCLLFTAYLALDGKIQIGDIVMYQSYFATISGNVQSIISIYPNFSKGMESASSIAEIMISDDIEDNKNKIRLRYVHGTVDFNNVYYRYPNTDKDIIKDFSLHVESGECIAFVGSSGSGKSTIMNMIIGFLKATEGTICIDGKPMDALNLSDYRHFISVVPQNSMLFDGTIRENILYGIDQIDERVFQRVLEQSNINEFLGTLPNGINTMVGESGSRLSGGQKQRISIARALIRDPKILILDEATSALDNISEYQVQKAISQLIKQRTTFIVAHRLSTIRDADRIVVMDNGRCVESGTFDELVAKKGKFYELKNLNEMNAKEENV